MVKALFSVQDLLSLYSSTGRTMKTRQLLTLHQGVWPYDGRETAELLNKQAVDSLFDATKAFLKGVSRENLFEFLRNTTQHTFKSLSTTPTLNKYRSPEVTVDDAASLLEFYATTPVYNPLWKLEEEVEFAFSLFGCELLPRLKSSPTQQLRELADEYEKTAPNIAEAHIKEGKFRGCTYCPADVREILTAEHCIRALRKGTPFETHQEVLANFLLESIKHDSFEVSSEVVVSLIKGEYKSWPAETYGLVTSLLFESGEPAARELAVELMKLNEYKLDHTISPSGILADVVSDSALAEWLLWADDFTMSENLAHRIQPLCLSDRKLNAHIKKSQHVISTQTAYSLLKANPAPLPFVVENSQVLFELVKNDKEILQAGLNRQLFQQVDESFGLLQNISSFEHLIFVAQYAKTKSQKQTLLRSLVYDRPLSVDTTASPKEYAKHTAKLNKIDMSLPTSTMFDIIRDMKEVSDWYVTYVQEFWQYLPTGALKFWREQASRAYVSVEFAEKIIALHAAGAGVKNFLYTSNIEIHQLLLLSEYAHDFYRMMGHNTKYVRGLWQLFEFFVLDEGELDEWAAFYFSDFLGVLIVKYKGWKGYQLMNFYAAVASDVPPADAIELVNAV